MEEVKYIPGDLVRINGVVNIIDGIYPKSFSKDRVVEARAIEGDNTNRYRYDLDFGKIVSIEPIPLTPAILEANGWEKSSLCLSYFKEYNKEPQRIFVFVDCQKGGRWYIEFNANKIYIQYYHQLQHLLFGLGLNSELKV